MKKLLSYFLQGLLVFVPIAVTIAVLVWAFTGIDRIFRTILGIKVPGLGFAVTIGIIFAIGIITSNFAGRKIFAIIDKLFKKLPLVNLLYGSLKDVMEALGGDKKKFEHPVVADLGDGLNAKALGFVTRESLERLELADYVAVYFPHSYNISGNMLLIKKAAVRPVDIDSSTAMTFIVSGGVAGQNIETVKPIPPTKQSDA